LLPIDSTTPRPVFGPEKPPTPSQATLQTTLDEEGAEETALVQHFDVEGAEAEAILGFDDDKEDEEDVDEENTFQDLPNASPELYKAFQASVRVQAATRAEGNRRKGGLVTQKAMVRAWLVGFHNLFNQSYSSTIQTGIRRTVFKIRDDPRFDRRRTFSPRLHQVFSRAPQTKSSWS
jgi:hypothetical protein